VNVNLAFAAEIAVSGVGVNVQLTAIFFTEFD
jgi:hypothetical protein